jgi:hypothetical protein
VPPEPVRLSAFVSDAGQAFVKFFGESNNRAARSMSVWEEVASSGSHFACTYPRERRQRQVEDGALMFMGRMVKDPDDILIYGQAIGMCHVEGRDDASESDIAIRDWKERWPHYIRVHHAEFVAGNLGNGVSLNELMNALGSDAFLATQRNAAKGTGNTDPRRAYRQQAHVELSQKGISWLAERLQEAYYQHGKLGPDELATLDLPSSTEQQS